MFFLLEVVQKAFAAIPIPIGSYLFIILRARYTRVAVKNLHEIGEFTVKVRSLDRLKFSELCMCDVKIYKDTRGICMPGYEFFCLILFLQIAVPKLY